MVFNYIVHISILKYFKCESTLPSPSGPLSKVVPCKRIKLANKEINKVVNGIKSTMDYIHGINSTSTNTIQAVVTQVLQEICETFTPEEKAQIGNRAAEHGMATTIWYAHSKLRGLIQKF